MYSDLQSLSPPPPPIRNICENSNPFLYSNCLGGSELFTKFRVFFFFLRLFEEAALKLNLTSLISFVKDLCAASHQQLFLKPSNYDKYHKWWNLKNLGKNVNADSDRSLFLSRINQVMLKCIRSGRPLMHIMKIWSLVGPHYIEVRF